MVSLIRPAWHWSVTLAPAVRIVPVVEVPPPAACFAWCVTAPAGNSTTQAPFNGRLAVLLAMAMFVLVVDTSLMNVSISAVVRDLDTTVSGVQSAIALEALVSAAFILISSKIGDLIGRKKAYVAGLVAYAVGASAAIAAAVGPLLAGFVTTFLSWRVGFGLEVVVIAIVLLNIKMVREVP